jgi:hypothetical protein
MEYLLIVNRFIPKSATRLTVGLANTAMRRILCIYFSQIRAIALQLILFFSILQFIHLQCILQCHL